MEKLLRVREASDLLRISKSGIYSLVSRHAIPCVRIGTRVLFRESDLERWLEEQLVESASRLG